MRLSATIAILTISFILKGFGQTDSSDTLLSSLILDESLFKESEAVFAAWVSYGGSRALWVNERFLELNPKEEKYRYSFDEELETRSFMCDVWEELSADSKSNDEYLDVLLKTKKAGFLSEYVWHYLRKPEWKKQPKSLRMDNFSTWRVKNIPGHKPKTLATVKLEDKGVERQVSPESLSCPVVMIHFNFNHQTLRQRALPLRDAV
ncbi:MAG: hypothetical protein L3J39_06410 [Verrucomicrobiales bacterium]|nr:hypothetical protein [Verrucomicrobiales bacterium]